ncbi:hypothetical protein [Microbulbifer pacificus]|uniref:Mutator family transposase n=1 Tax=Microbulbifer pacificus TaxID=407164 RepID=A0AAU0MWK3_9GAMM|nr:hypothetical protein [Microbulbifer pacificus]WOX04559.1 hypothetical protein R5R33_12500 [Microbulbifer pacificus]
MDKTGECERLALSQSLHESVTWGKSINAILCWSKTLIPRVAREGQKIVIDEMAGSESVSILIPSENCRSRKVMHQQRSDIKAGFMPAFVFLCAVDKNDIHVIFISDAVENAGAEASLCWVFVCSRRPVAATGTSCTDGHSVESSIPQTIATGRLAC